MASYADFEAMEFTPEISAALDIFMEEGTTTSEKGKVLEIFSESQRVKQALQELFYDVLDVETNLAPWTRNTCKYGDNFVQLRIDPKKGIIGCQQLPNILIERREPGYLDIGEFISDALRKCIIHFYAPSPTLPV